MKLDARDRNGDHIKLQSTWSYHDYTRQIYDTNAPLQFF